MAVEVRAPTWDEAAAIAEVLNAHSQALWGVDSLSAADVEHWFSIPTIEPEHDMRVAVGGDGELAGYADVNGGGPERTRFWIDMRLRPGTDEATGDALVAVVETRARERAVRVRSPAASSPSPTSRRSGSSRRGATRLSGTPCEWSGHWTTRWKNPCGRRP